jgi:tetratricopeptide (TPR) repeat protein
MSETTRLPHKLSVRKKLVFAVITTAFIVVAVELTLAALGIRPRTNEDPYVGFSSYSPVMHSVRDENGEDMLVTSTNKLVWFNPQTFPLKKPAATRRIVCVGGSTTYGHPFADATSFSGYLRKLLPLADPSHHYEVINAGGISYASYRVAAVMEEFAAYDPDLFIVYSVHNEFLERRTYASMFEKPQWRIGLESALRKSRTWAAMETFRDKLFRAPSPSDETLTTEVDERLNHTSGPTDYVRDDEWQQKVLHHYEFNLNRMVAIAKAAGAEILFIEPASNEKDCSPFKSDEKFYEDGRDLFELGHYDDALVAFKAAIDRDICPLRATTQIGEIVRRVAQQHQVGCVPFCERLRKDCLSQYGHPCLGEEYFVDHVHPTIEVNKNLATWIVDTLSETNWISQNKLDATSIASVDSEIRGAIVTRDHAISFRNLAKVLHWAGKFDEASRRALDALRLLPEDPESRYVLADCFTRLERYDEALEQYKMIFEVTDYERAILPYGELLAYRNQYELAKIYLTMATASEKEPDRKRAFRALGDVHTLLGEVEQAAEAYSHL